MIAWKDVENLVKVSYRTLLYGPPGMGKTTIAMKTLRDPLAVTLNEESTVAELLGHWVPKGDSFVWHDGALTKAWKEGRGLVINEINYASGAVLTLLNAGLDDPEVAEIYLPNGEVIRPKEGYQVVATMNGKPEELPEPLRDRFEVKVEIREPHPEAVRRLPSWGQNHFSSKKNWNFTLRELIAVDKLISSGVSIDIAAEAVVGRGRARDLANLVKIVQEGGE